MANYCDYRAKIWGKKNKCYAFLGNLPVYESKYISVKEGTDDFYHMEIKGNCKWSLYHNAKAYSGEITIPDDFNEAEKYGETLPILYPYERFDAFDIDGIITYADTDNYDEHCETSYNYRFENMEEPDDMWDGMCFFEIGHFYVINELEERGIDFEDYYWDEYDDCVVITVEKEYFEKIVDKLEGLEYEANDSTGHGEDEYVDIAIRYEREMG